MRGIFSQYPQRVKLKPTIVSCVKFISFNRNIFRLRAPIVSQISHMWGKMRNWWLCTRSMREIASYQSLSKCVSVRKPCLREYVARDTRSSLTDHFPPSRAWVTQVPSPSLSHRCHSELLLRLRHTFFVQEQHTYFHCREVLH